MFRVVMRRLLPVFLVFFALFAQAGTSQARIDQRFERALDAPEQKKIVKRSYRRAHFTRSHYTRSRYTRSHARSHRRAYYRAKAYRNRHAHARVHKRVRSGFKAGVPARSAGVVEARIDLKAQRMVVKVNGEVAHVWRVSTARKGFVTPRGVYAPQRMHVSYFSKKYYNSPMPYSIFFRGGYAVHGTGATGKLGRPASHGCVRLATGNARTLYNLVKSHGTRSARIIIG